MDDSRFSVTQLEDMIQKGFRTRSDNNQSMDRESMDDFNSFFTSATPIGKHINTDEEDVVSRMHKLPTIALTMTVLIGLAVILSALSIWGMMYALNLRGLDGVSAVVGNQTILNLKRVYTEFLNPSIESVQVITEHLRLGELSRPGFIASKEWLRVAFQLANQFGGSCYCGFANGSLFGYRLYSSNVSDLIVDRVVLVNVSANGTAIRGFYTDVQGQGIKLAFMEPQYSVTTRPWYAGADMVDGFYTSSLYILPGLNRVGFTSAMPITADLLQSKFSPSNIPFSALNSTKSNATSFLGVCGVDLDLKGPDGLSVRLMRMLIGLGNGVSCVFNSMGMFLASNDPTDNSTDRSTGGPVFMTSVSNRIINETMKFLLDRSGIPENAYARYGEVLEGVNLYHDIAGERRIVSMIRLDSFRFAFVVTPYSDYFSQSAYSNQVALLIVFLVITPFFVFLSVVFGYFSFSRPAKKLAQAMLAIPLGFDFSADRGKQSYIREMALMQNSFDSMQLALRSFGKFTPTTIVKEMLSKRMEAVLGVTDIEATCMFSDIEGFTSVSERVIPSLLIKVLEDYFNNMTEIIEEAQGTVGDFIGDAIFAFFGAPTPVGPRHAYMCVEAALKQQERLVQLRAKWKKDGWPELRARIGINSGRCLAGNVGSRTRLKFTLIGDSVNLAARLEALGKYYGSYLTMSQNTLRQPGVAMNFCVRVLDTVRVVGKSVPCPVLEVVCRRPQATPAQLEVERLSFVMMTLYMEGNLAECLRVLNNMDELRPDDMAIHSMRDRVGKLMDEGLPKNWTGIATMSEK